MTATAPAPSRGRFSIAELVMVVPWVALVIVAWAPIRDNSFLWHIRAGELQMDLETVLTSDPFSFTMRGEDWLTQSWLAELLYSWAEDVASGLGFVPPMMLVITVTTFAALGLVAYRRSSSTFSTALVVLLSVLVMISFLVPRPVIFSFALFGLVLLAWEEPRLRWALPFLFWIWASVHGSFAMGLAYVVLALVSEREWRWIPTVIVSGFLTLATAHGLGVLTMLLEFGAARDTLALLSEWRTPTLTDPAFAPFVSGLVIIAVGIVRKRLPLGHLWVVVPFAALGFTSLRAVPPAWIGLVPSVASALGPLKPATARRLGMGSAVVFGTVVFLLPFFLKDEGELSAERFPVIAAQHLEVQPTFHDDRTGGYLIWLRGTDFPVYIDDRAELYRERMADYVAVREGREPWKPHFRKEGIEQALLASDSELVTSLRQADWSTVYEDEAFSVLRAP